MLGNLQINPQGIINSQATAYEATRSHYAKVFSRLAMTAKWRQFCAWLKGSRRELLNLNAYGQVNGRHYLGVRLVALAQITGSEGRAADYDIDFLPRQQHDEERWVGVATARRLGKPMPPVELVQIGSNYFVRDGHHRVSIARALGELEIEAEVTRWETN